MFDLPNQPGPARDAAIMAHVVNGTIDPIVYAPITANIPGHTATFFVFADAMKIGGVRFGAGAGLAQQIADAVGCSLITPRLLDMAYEQRGVTVFPQPMYNATKMMTSEWFIAHSKKIDEVLAKTNFEPGMIVQTTGKPWVLDNRLLDHPGRAINYSWYVPPGTPDPWNGVHTLPSVSLPNVRVIQDPGWAHGLDQADYSETVTLVRQDCIVDGVIRKLSEVLTSPTLAPLASHQGPLKLLRQPGVPALLPLAHMPPCSGPNCPKQVSVTNEERTKSDMGLVLLSGIAAALVIGGFFGGLALLNRKPKAVQRRR